MNQNNKIATVFGGTGFVGRQVVRELARAGYTVKVATRVPERAYFLKPHGSIGQVVPLACDYRDEKSVRQAVAGASCVVNFIGILFEKRGSKFRFAHTELPEIIAKACRQEGIERFVHISALGIEKSKSKYAQSKLAGEHAVLKAFPAAVILRPSVIFGPDDNFFNMFAEMSRFLPALPLIGGGRTKFQPCYVGDVADAVMAALRLPVEGNTFELGGPEVLTFREIFQRLFEQTGRKRRLIALPWGVAKIDAAFLGLLPKPPLTVDQVESLKTDSIVSEKAKGFADLGVKPVAMDMILPRYLTRYRAGGVFAGESKKA